MMTFKRGKRIIKCLFSVYILLVLNIHIAVGARMAGEEGASPNGPGSDKAPGMQTPPDRRQKTVPPLPTGKTPARVPTQRTAKQKPMQKQQTDKKNEPADRYVTIDFDDVDITVFIKFISELTGKNFVIDKGVGGNVTIISPTKISIDEAYKVFESVLEVHDYATVPAGNIIKIVPAAIAKSKSIETRTQKEAISPEDKMVTQLIPLKYADPNELKALFTPFVSKSSLIVPYAPTGTLIVTDVLSNINRILKIIEEIDVEGIGVEVFVIPLEHATASVLEKSLTSIFQGGARKIQRRGPKGAEQSIVEGSINITSDERTNSLIILASENDGKKIKQMVKLLDKEIPRGEGDIHVYYLQNANAEDLVSVLKALPSEQTEPQKKGAAPVVSKDVEIVADKATNSMVITAKKSDYLVLENVIKKLDIMRRMVYIEALLMEVSTTNDFNVGVSWQYGKQNLGDVQGQDLSGIVSSATGAGSGVLGSESLNLPSGFLLGVLGDTINVGGYEFTNLGALIQAYESDSEVHILSTPQIMTMDNEEAEIIVAENIPFLTRQTSSDEGVYNYNNYEYKDVGVTLKITPQINQENFVRLNIFQEVSQIADVSADETGVVRTLRREATTTVVVQDGNTIVIGGLIGETLNNATSKTPCLGDIPGLGWLFKAFGDSSDKTNLYIFITPHVVACPADAMKVYNEKRKNIQDLSEGKIKTYQKPWSGTDLSDNIQDDAVNEEKPEKANPEADQP